MTNILSFDKYLDRALHLLNLYEIVKTIQAPMHRRDFPVYRQHKPSPFITVLSKKENFS